MKLKLFLFLLLSLILGGCSGGSSTGSTLTSTYTVVNTFPHDPAAFTQGLVFKNGLLYESTGRVGQSSVRTVELTTGRVLSKVDIPSPYFAEGLTLLNGKLFQLTWQNQKGFLYDPISLASLGEFAYSGEGWGLTDNGSSLIQSNGSNILAFLNPDTLQIEKTIAVFDNGKPLVNLNELEYVRGEIYANIWHSDKIARIDPATGTLLGWIDLTGLFPASERPEAEAVLNGIAYDAPNDRLFVTGKLWPKLFEIKLVAR